MPIGVPRIIYCWGEELPAQWTDIYNFIFRRRMVFLMQYLDDELCNQICGLLINIHMEDRSKELEKKEMERSGVFSREAKSKNSLTSSNSLDKGDVGKASNEFYNKKSRSMEDLLNADEDLSIDDVDALEQRTLQKITNEWLNWVGAPQVFDSANGPTGDSEPYLFYLAELLSKDFNKSQYQHNFTNNAQVSEVSQLLNLLKYNANVTSNNFGLNQKASLQMGEIYSPFRKNALFSNQNAKFNNSYAELNKKQALLQMLQKYNNKNFSSNSALRANNKINTTISKLLSSLVEKDFSSKFASSDSNSNDFISPASIKQQRQKNLRSSFSLEKNFSNFQVPLGGVDNSLSYQNALLQSNQSLKAFNYLNSGSSVGNLNDSLSINSEFRNYYRKQTERTLIDEESKKVFVIINSFGGSVGNGITVHDALQFIKAGSLTLALGVAASAASLALAGGTIGERYVTEGCHVMIHQPECLTPNHKVLTDEGWLPISKVTLKHKVAVLNKQGVMSYEHPLKIHQYNYKGRIYRVKTTGIDLCVTENHRMFVNTKARHNEAKTEDYQLLETNKIFGRQARYKNNAIWNAPDYQCVLPPSFKDDKKNSMLYPEYRPLMKPWLKLVGFWIAEGHTSTGNLGKDNRKRYDVVFTQTKQEGVEFFMQACKELNLSVYVKNEKTESGSTQYAISNKQLWEFFNPLGADALKKRLPSWVWNLSATQCEYLLEGLIAGNGHINKNDGTKHYLTGSKQLAYDVARLILHTGAAASITFDKGKSRRNRVLRNQVIKTSNYLYRVNVIKSRYTPYANDKSPLITSKNEPVNTNDFWIDNYEGPVYCLTVPNEVFYVMRSGVAVWTGNSAIQGQASDIWIDSQEIMKIRLDVAEIYSLSTYRPRHKILRDLDRDFYLTASETIQYGLADEIATNEVMHVILEETNRAWDYHDSKQQRLLETRESASAGLDTQTQN